MKKFLSFAVAIVLLLGILRYNFVYASEEKYGFDVEAKSAILMDYNTGTVLYEKNADEALPPASVTKIMTLLLIMEAIESGKLTLDSVITVSEYAASMGGSQVFLEAGETMRAEELIKSIIIASGNDAAVAMAEAVGGSESVFVQMMNKRAAELGMVNSVFENVTGLDDDVTNHVTSARDIALMSRELMKHKKIFEYSTLWMDSIRDGAFGLTNTNRLIRFYNGATGLKTGSTGKAGFCISATAEREGLHLIAVIMGSETRDKRNNAAKALLDYGFANYSIYKADGGEADVIKVKGGCVNSVKTVYDGCEILVKIGEQNNVKTELKMSTYVKAPVEKGQVVGSVYYYVNGEKIHESEVKVEEKVEKISYFRVLRRMLSSYLLK